MKCLTNNTHHWSFSSYRVALRERLVDASESQLAPNPSEGQRVLLMQGQGAAPKLATVLHVNNMVWCVQSVPACAQPRV